MARIHHVAARLSAESSRLLGSPGKQLHATIAYSREWFPYKPRFDLWPMVIVPPFVPAQFGPVRVVRFTDWGLTRRHEELLAAGAAWDYPDFKAHISVPDHLADLDGIPWMVLEGEYYMTWEAENDGSPGPAGRGRITPQ